MWYMRRLFGHHKMQSGFALKLGRRALTPSRSKHASPSMALIFLPGIQIRCERYIILTFFGMYAAYNVYYDHSPRESIMCAFRGCTHAIKPKRQPFAPHHHSQYSIIHTCNDLQLLHMCLEVRSVRECALCKHMLQMPSQLLLRCI